MSSEISRRVFTGSLLAGSAGLAFGRASAQSATPVAESSGTISASVEAALAQLPSFVQEMQDETGVPGIAVGVVYQDEAVFLEGFGEREVGTGTPVGPDTVFQIASVSKPVSSTIVSAIVGEGAIGWDAKVADLYPGFALSDPWVTANVTLADLFSHRSGLPDHAGDELEDLGGTREEVLHALRHIELKGAFRDSYAYTNFGLTAAAEAVAVAEGTTWEDLGDTLLFQPAGMTRTSFRYDDFVARDDRCVGHIRQDGEWIHAFDRQPDPQAPAGGVSSSIADLTRWMRLQMNHGELDGSSIVDATALGHTHLPHATASLPDPPYDQMPGFYGLGWNVGYDPNGTVTLSHSGAFALGAATAVYLWPGEGLGIVVLTNGAPIGVPESICLSFQDLCFTGEIQMRYLDLLEPFMERELVPHYGAAVQEPPAQAEPHATLESYAGTYGNDVFGTLLVEVVDQALLMTLGPDSMEFQLRHVTRDVFAYTVPGENGGQDSAVTFTLDATGTASQVVVENLNLYDAGTFTRQEA